MTGVGFGRLLRRDLLLVLRQGGDALLTLAFYLLAVAIFPCGVGPEAQLLAFQPAIADAFDEEGLIEA